MKSSPRRQRASSHPRGEVLKRSRGVATRFSEFSPFILVIKHTSWGGVNRYCDTKSSALSEQHQLPQRSQKQAICPWLEEKEEKERGELGQSGAFLKSALSKCRYLKRVLKAGCMGHRE